MPFLPAKEVVNAAARSTKDYFELLRSKEANVTKHRATGIRPHTDEQSALENTVWHTYLCQLPQHLRLRSDTPATLTALGVPGERIEIRILEYDRRSGLAKFAARSPVICEAGDIAIDFSWLVQRCLDWYQQHGASIPSIDEIADTGSHDPHPAECLSTEASLSNQQREAVKATLSAGLSYIWGPPGTGKTFHVLREAVRCCVHRGQRVLVLASTNLAVDNALRAVLSDEGGVPRDLVARIGWPSPEFIKDYAECCEERAFEHEIKHVKAQIRTLRDNIASVHRKQQIEALIQQHETALEQQRSQLALLQASLSRLEEELHQAMELLSNREQERQGVCAQVTSKQSRLEALSFPALLSEIAALEAEQVRAIGEIADLREKLEHLGLLARAFTGRRHRLSETISRQTVHLHSVEDTLRLRREKRHELAPIVSQLDAQIQKLGLVLDKASAEIDKVQHRVSVLRKHQAHLRSKVSQSEDHAHRLQNLANGACDELSQIAERYPQAANEDLLSRSQNQLEELEDQLSRLRQDLSAKMVLGMTLDGFIGATMQEPITADHVFIDEAPYAHLAKVLPVLSLRCPVAMLGDHRQLPPVFAGGDGLATRAYWEKSALFLEDAFRYGSDWGPLNRLEDPVFERTVKRDLTASYRFGQSLASLLDRHVYGNVGLRGLAADTRICCIDCEPRRDPSHKPRENSAEAKEIVERIAGWWEWAQQQQQPELPTIAILTPYKNQVNFIRTRLRERFRGSELVDHVEVLNTHKAQGREWDWVLFSVSDTANLPGNGPFFSDTTCSNGRAVLNTTISRAKKHLRIFLDMQYWKQREPQSLLTELAHNKE